MQEPRGTSRVALGSRASKGAYRSPNQSRDAASCRPQDSRDQVEDALDQAGLIGRPAYLILRCPQRVAPGIDETVEVGGGVVRAIQPSDVDAIGIGYDHEQEWSRAGQFNPRSTLMRRRGGLRGRNRKFPPESRNPMPGRRARPAVARASVLKRGSAQRSMLPLQPVRSEAGW